jgi:hypothetical protein
MTAGDDFKAAVVTPGIVDEDDRGRDTRGNRRRVSQ